MTKNTRELHTFLEVRPASRKTPNSIRKLLFEFVVDEHCGDCGSAVNALNSASSPLGVERAYQRKIISHEGLYNIARDRTPISYHALDSFARHHRVPVSVVLLFTRIASELDADERRKELRASRAANAFAGVIGKLQQLASIGEDPASETPRLHYSDFKEIAQLYCEKYDEKGLFG